MYSRTRVFVQIYIKKLTLVGVRVYLLETQDQSLQIYTGLGSRASAFVQNSESKELAAIFGMPARTARNGGCAKSLRVTRCSACRVELADRRLGFPSHSSYLKLRQQTAVMQSTVKAKDV